MKVNDTKQPTAVQPAADAAGAGPSRAELAPAPDRVSTEEADHLKKGIVAGKRLAAGERALRLQSLAQQVRSGSYRPSVSRLAEEILAHAELEARLAQSLG